MLKWITFTKYAGIFGGPSTTLTFTELMLMMEGREQRVNVLFIIIFLTQMREREEILKKLTTYLKRLNFWIYNTNLNFFNSHLFFNVNV